MAASDQLLLPFLEAGQAQKHVTVNEALRRLDALALLSVLSRTTTAPPGSPTAGDRYIVPTGATGAWSGYAGRVAAWQDGAWAFYVPRQGWRAFVADEHRQALYTGGAWELYDVISPFGAAFGLAQREAEVTVSGATTDSAGSLIPARSVVVGVSVRTTLAITGATSFNCGVAGDTSKFGATLGIALGSTNVGVVGPTAYYADTPVRLTANGGSFSGGKVRITTHLLVARAALS